MMGGMMTVGKVSADPELRVMCKDIACKCVPDLKAYLKLQHKLKKRKY